jgi:MFS family permease
MAETIAVPAPAATRDARLIGAFMFGHFTHHVTNSLLAPLLPLIRDGFGLSYAQSGWLVSAFSMSQGLSQAPIGVLADRIGSRTVVTIGLLITGLSCFLIGLAGEYWLLLLLLVGLGIVAGTYHAPAASLLARVFEPHRRGAALGMHIMGGNLSFFATPLVAGGLAAATANWRVPYLAFAIAPVVAGLFLMLVLPSFRDRAAGLAESAGFMRELARVFQIVGPLLGLAVLFQMMYAAVLAFLALYLVDARSFERPLAAVMVSLPYIGGLFGSPLGGLLSDRLGRKPVIVASLVCLGPLLLLFTMTPTVALIPLLILMGFVSSTRMPVIEGLLLDRAPADRRATTLGAYYLVAQELGGIAAPVLGVLAGAFGIAETFGGVAVVAACLSFGVLLLQHKL